MGNANSNNNLGKTAIRKKIAFESAAKDIVKALDQVCLHLVYTQLLQHNFRWGSLGWLRFI